jgi:hypothetical protein
VPNNQTQIPAPRVPISEQNNIPTREWFRYFNAIYEFLGLSRGIIPETSGGTGNITYATGDLLYASAPDTLSRLPVPGQACYLGTDATNMPQWIPVAYGAFVNTDTQTAPASTPTGITFNVTDYSRGVTISGSQVTVTETGLYTIIFSLQLSNPSTSNDDDAIVWLRVNGSDVVNTATHLTVVKSHGGVPGSGVMTVNFFQQFTAGDYFEIYGMSVLGNLQLKTYPAGTSPAYPVAPAAILTVSQII